MSDRITPFAIKFIQTVEEQLLIEKEREIERLTRENEELRKDAGRYRLLRVKQGIIQELDMYGIGGTIEDYARALDIHVDAALAKQGVKDE